MKCKYCKKKKSILLDCKYCNKEYCSSCIDIISHKCINLDDCKKRKRDELKERLFLEKMEGEKLIKI